MRRPILKTHLNAVFRIFTNHRIQHGLLRSWFGLVSNVLCCLAVRRNSIGLRGRVVVIEVTAANEIGHRDNDIDQCKTNATHELIGDPEIKGEVVGHDEIERCLLYTSDAADE